MRRPLVLWKCLVSEKTVNKETLLEMIFFLWTAENEVWFPTLFFLHFKSRACLYYKHYKGVHLPCVATSFSSSFQQCPVHPLIPSGTCWCSQCFPSKCVPARGPAMPLPPPQLCPVFGESCWVLTGRQLLLTKMNCPVSALTGWNKVSVLYPGDRPG